MLYTFVQNIIIPFRDFIYPPLCFVCEQRLGNGNDRVCPACWSSFAPFHVSDPVWHELTNRFVQEGVVSDFLSCFYFEREGKLQEVIHLLKYRGIKTMGVLLGREIGKRIIEHESFSAADYLVPIPLHTLKRRERGYNQSDFLANGITEITGIPMNTRIVQRAKYTQSQTQLNLEERQANVGDAFEVPSKCVDEVRGKTIILVDDVITTGSTINACARELIHAGAKTVLAASAAVA